MSSSILRMLPWIVGISGSFFIGCFHLQRMLSKPHYQYLVFLPLMMWAIAKTRPATRLTIAPHGYVSNIGLVCSVGLLCAASLLWSPWIAIGAVIAAAFWYCWGTFSRRDFRRWFPVWLMSCFLLPLPFGWDERITLRLRGLATLATSQILDFFGVLHIQYVNVIEVPAKKLFIADACSGVHSLYVLLAASVFWAILQKRRVVHLILLVGITLVVVLIENTSRLVLIVAALGWRVDLSEGTYHQIFGSVLFLASALLLLSADHLLLFFFPFKKTLVAQQFDRPQIPSKQTPFVRTLLFFSGSLFLTAGLIQWIFMPGPLPNVLASFQIQQELPLLDKEILPDAFEGFRREEFSHIERVVGDPFGQQSQQWTFSDDTGLVVQVSIDYPFDGFHDSTLCYSQVGWAIEAAMAVNDVPAPYAIVQMKQKLEGEAVLIFCQIDQAGIVYARLKDRTDSIRADSIGQRLKSLLALGPQAVERPAKLPLIQFQLLARSSSRLKDSDLIRIEQFFSEFRKLSVRSLGLPVPNGM